MKSTILLAALALCVPASAAVQEVKPERSTDTDWHWVQMTKYHSGKGERAGELIRQYFDPVEKEIGTQFLSIHMNTGEWDRIETFKMAGGASDLGWRVSPNEAKFMNALARKAGSMAAAEKLLAEFDTLVARRETHIAHTHR